jgi:hypothetical protein
MSRFVVDCDTLLRIAAGEIEVAAEHTLLAPTLVRSQALASLYEAARRGEISSQSPEPAASSSVDLRRLSGSGADPGRSLGLG